MNPADDEINILLPLMFVLIIGFFGAIIGGIFWILSKNGIIKLPENSQLFSVFRAAILSILGVFVLSAIAGVAIFVIQIIKNFISK